MNGGKEPLSAKGRRAARECGYDQTSKRVAVSEVSVASGLTRLRARPYPAQTLQPMLRVWLSPIAFGNQTISPTDARQTAQRRPRKTHGFAPPPRDRFALIVCNRCYSKERAVGQVRANSGQID